MSLAKSFLREARKRHHTITIVLNKNLTGDVSELVSSLTSIQPDVKFLYFRVPTPCEGRHSDNEWRHRAAEILREYFLSQLQPNFLHVTTMLADCWRDESIASVCAYFYTPTALTHYDLIPLAMEEAYLPEGQFRREYFRKIESVKRADLLLAISGYSRTEAIELLHLEKSSVVNISSAVEEDFSNVDTTLRPDVMARLGLRKGFLLYAPGGFDPRKNLNRLIEAFATLPPNLRSGHQLVIVSKLSDGQLEAWTWKGGEAGLSAGELVLTDYVSDNDLKQLYSACHAYVFPSLHEGFGLPALEAMAFGAAVIASECTSIPEAVGIEEALFDPRSVESIARRLEQVLTDDEYLERLRSHSAIQLTKFSWQKTAILALDAIETAHGKIVQPIPRQNQHVAEDLLKLLSNARISVEPSEDDLRQFRVCFEENKLMVEK